MIIWGKPATLTSVIYNKLNNKIFTVRHDSTVNSFKLCDPIAASQTYDGKMVRIKGMYFQGVERLDLGDAGCLDQLRATHINWDEKTERIRKQILELRQPKKARVELIGRFRANVLEPIAWSRPVPNIKLLENHEINGVEIVNTQ